LVGYGLRFLIHSGSFRSHFLNAAAKSGYVADYYFYAPAK
jgi:hypothetical protein